MHGSVLLAASDRHLGLPVAFLPVYAVALDPCLRDFTHSVIVVTTDQIGSQVAWVRGEGSTLTRWGHMGLMWRLLQDLHTEAFSFLHPLDVGLNTTDQFVGQFIFWDILMRLCQKSLKVIVLALRFAHDKMWLWSVLLQS